MTDEACALSGIRILDLTDERGIYGVKLLADLGADVVRPEPPEGDNLRKRGPVISEGPDATSTSDGVGASLWHAYFASSRRFVTLDLATPDGLSSLRLLVANADIVITCRDAFAVAEADLKSALDARPELVVVDVSSFGDEGPWKDFLAPDLIAGALGGAVATTGDSDTEPLKSFGELNFMVSGAYAAIAALSGWLAQRSGGGGQRVGVSLHESIVSCLDHVLMWYWYEDLLAHAQGPVLKRQGGRHWSNAYEVMNASNGSIMVTPTPDVESQLFWLVEEDVQEDLIDPKYLEPENRVMLVTRMMEILRKWVAGKDVEQLFFEAQERHSPYGWVLPVERLAVNPQLEARNWWAGLKVAGRALRGPGAPYRFSDTPWRVTLDDPPGEQAVDLDHVLAAAGWQDKREPRENSKDAARAGEAVNSSERRPLDGLRVLDFTHVLAGPFATRILSDMGADVIKVNSAARAEAANNPNRPYYVMWNRGKRAIALNMSDPQTQPIARALALKADVVIDNFSVGVLDRWGIGFDSVSRENKGVVYTQMSGMGEGGPWSKFVTYAPTIHALCGLTQLTGVPGREDIGIGFSYNDHQAGLHAVVAILSALAARDRTGCGQRIDLSQFETGVNFLGPAILDWFANENAARPTGNELPYDLAAPHGVYPCLVNGCAGEDWLADKAHSKVATADEQWVAIACMTDDQWQKLVVVLGAPAWSTDPTLQTAAGRVSVRHEIDKHLRAWTSTQEAHAVMNLCQAAGVPAGVVQSGTDLLETDPMLAASGFAQPIDEHAPDIGQTFADRLPLHFSAMPCNHYTRVRTVGEDNASVLGDWLGMTAEDVQAAEADGRLT